GEVDAGLVPARPGGPPRVASPDRPLPRGVLPARLRGPAAPAGGARRRARVLRRAASSGRGRSPHLRRGPDAADEGLLAPAPPGLRVVQRPRAGGGGFARARGRRVPRLPGRARPLSRDLPELGAGRADPAGNARARPAGPLPAG